MSEYQDPTQTVHKAVADIVQEVYDLYGVKIDGINFDWITRMDGTSTLVTTRIDSSKHA